MHTKGRKEGKKRDLKSPDKHDKSFLSSWIFFATLANYEFPPINQTHKKSQKIYSAIL